MLEKNLFNRVGYIDSLRGLAAMMVVFTHSWIVIPETYPALFHQIVGEGARGVQLFFIISAFTLFLSLEKLNYTGQKDLLLLYFIRRFFRIAPLFYFAILISLIFKYFLPHFDHLTIKNSFLDILTSITFTNGFFPTMFDSLVPNQWTISVEMLFYVFVPYLFIKVNTFKKSVRLYVVTSFITLILSMLFIFAGKDNPHEWVNKIYFIIYTSFPFQLPNLLLGIVYFFVIKEGKSYKDVLGVLSWASIQTIIFGIYQKIIVNKFDISMISPRIQVETILFILLIIFITKNNFPFINNKVMRYIGKISYGSYLLHFFVLVIIGRLINSLELFNELSIYYKFIIMSTVCSISTIFIASITYKYIESPGQKLGLKVFNFLKNKQP